MNAKFWDAVALVGVIILTLVALLGCSTLRTLEPDYLPVEVDHVSHLTEHQPFTDHPHSYGYNDIAIGAKWVPMPHLSITVSEGVILEGRHVNTFTGTQWHGSLMGPKEVFTGRLVYDIPLK